jgi:hypothetical protein
MANNTGFTYTLSTFGSGTSENDLVNQASPCWVLSFVTWKERDTLRTNPTNGVTYTTVGQKPVVVENDCVQLSTVDAKSTLTPSFNATLLMTDVNYETEIAPGDFCFVNILNWEQDARRVANQARNNQPINGPNDGFKGFYKVQGVRKTLMIDPVTGTKRFAFKINGFAFTEFNNVIYFNQSLIDQSEQNNVLLFASNISTNWSLLVNNKGLTNVQDLIKVLIESFIGTGISDQGKFVKGIVKSPNTLFFMPGLVGKLLNVPTVTAAKDVYNYLFGVQTYNASANQTLQEGMNPVISQDDGRFFETVTNCQGDAIHKPEYWDQVQVWSILNEFSNSPLNELYTCFRISPDGDVMPTVVFRQIPFNNDSFYAGQTPITRFMNLPRWKLLPELVFNFDLGRDEAARINFVQYFGRSTIGPQGYPISEETAQKNYLYDIEDVQRSGLRPYIVSTLFDEPVNFVQKQAFHSPIWAKIVGDCLIGGQLKMNGTIECVGLVQPIAVGDNLQFDGVIYHIEQIVHNCTINAINGIKTFRTTIQVSNGLNIDSSTAGLKYAEMTYADAYKLRQVDYNNNKILPGVSESQNVVYRQPNLDTPYSTTDSYQQTNTGTSINSSQRNSSNGESDNT